MHVPVPPPYRNPCKISCRTMELCSLLFTIYVQTFQMVSTSHIPLYSLSLIIISTIVVHINASMIYPSQNSTFVTLITFSHSSVSRSFSLVAFRNHDLRFPAFIPDGPPTLPNRSSRTVATISPPSGGPSAILTGCTSIGSGSPSGGHCM